MTEFGVRLVAYEPAGARIGVLPSPLAAQASVVRNDAGALTATYSRLALRGEVLDRALSTGLEIAVEVTNHAGAWVEPAGGRFVWVAREDDLADRAEVVKMAAPSWGWLLGRARLLDLENLLPEDHSQAGKRPFYSASAGVILATLMQENAARGGVPVTAGFTTVADSAGVAWSQVATLYYEPGIDLRTVLTNLADQGMCDWTTAGRTLRVYNPDVALATDRAKSVRLHLGRDVAEAPSSQSLEEVVSRVLLRGDAGLTLTLDNPQAPTPWGAWEGYLSQGGVSDASTATRLVQSELERRARTRAQYTRALILPGADVWPLVDYSPGDWITAPTDQASERVRVQQVTLTLGADGVGGTLVLNDRVLDAEIRRSRRMSGIVGGSQADGGSGARPAPQGPDKRTPAAPLGLVVDSDAFIDTDGAARGLLDVDWGDVATASDGTALEVAGYDVAVRENIVGAPWSVVQSVEASQAVISPVQVGAVLQVKVRARGRFTTTPGLWSAVATVTVADDVTPPAVPSTPVASVDRAVVRVTWDGKTSAGGTMPRDFDRVEIASDAAPTVPVGTVLAAGGGFILVTGLAYGEPVRYRARAVDRSGNASSWSAYSAAVTPAPLVSEDIDATITAAIDANRADLDALRPTVTQAVTDLAAAETRLGAAEGLAADAITIANGANNASADALARAHSAQEAADQANAAASAAVQGAGNVIGANWSFELGNLTGWTTSGQAFAVVASSTAAHGGHVAQHTAAGSAGAIMPTENAVAATGQTWLLRARVRVVGALPTAGSVSLFARTRNSAGATTDNLVVTVPATALTTTWQAIEGQYVIPAGDVVGIRPHLLASAALTTGAVVQWDAVELRDWTQVKAALAAAATAQAAADAAHQAAGSAQDTADSAVTSAAGATATAAAAQAAADAAAARAANLVVDGSFEQAGSGAWWYGGAWARTAVADAPDGSHVARLTSTGAWSQISTQPAWLSAVAPGAVVRVQVRLRRVGTVTAGVVRLQVRTYDGTTYGSQAVLSVEAATIPTAWTVYTGTYTVPAGVVRVGGNIVATAEVPAGSVIEADLVDIRDVTEAAAALAAAQAVPRIHHSTAVPSGTAPAGSTWMRRAADGGVIGQWEQTTAPSGGTWVSRPIRSEVIANLDVGKLTAGTSVVVEQVAQKIAASTAAFQTADVGNLFVSNTATVGQAVANAIWTQKLVAGRVLANEVLIGGGTNLLADPTFSEGGAGWFLSAAASVVTVGDGPGGAATQVLRINGASASRLYNRALGTGERLAPMPAGSSFRIRMRARLVSGSTGSLRVILDRGAAGGSSVGPVVAVTLAASSAAAGSWAWVEGVASVGPHTGMGVCLDTIAGNAIWEVDQVIVADMADASLIVDGAVRARHVGAAEVEGYHVKANTLTADNAVVGFLDGYVITGALIQTVAAANRGVKISGDGLIAYNGSGQVTVQIDGTNGTLSIANGMLVGAMLADGAVTGPKIASGAVASAQIAANAVGTTQIASGAVASAQIAANAVGTTQIASDAVGSAQVAAGAVTRAKIANGAVGTVQIANGAVTADIIAANAVTAGKVHANAINGMTITGATVQTDTGAVGSGSGIRLNGTGNSATINVWSGSNSVTLNPGGGQPYIRWERGTSAAYSAYAATSNRWTVWDNLANGQVITASRSQFWAQGATATSTASVNCRVGGSGDLYTVTSLRAMKLLIEDAPDAWADAALALRPRTWLDKPSHDAWADYLSGEREEPGNPVPLSTRIPGFVAEEVREVAPGFCTYDNAGNLTGVQYDRIPAALVALAQRQQTQIDDLTARIETLETP